MCTRTSCCPIDSDRFVLIRNVGTGERIWPGSSESVTTGMGGAVSGDVIQLNRRGGASGGEGGSWVPLVWAAKVGHVQVGEQLLANGVNINVQEGAGSHSQRFTALHMACNKGHTDFVELLLSKGADVSIKDVNGTPAKAIAQKKGKDEIVAMIEAYAKSSKAKGAA